MSNPKLHEVLAVISDLEGTAKKVREEALNTFSKKAPLFQGYHKTLTMFDDARKQEESGAEEHKALVTTVGDKLEYLKKSQVKYYDAILQQEATNQTASADLIIDGEVYAKDVPATFLLGMESRLKSLRAVFALIPTLDPSVEWVKDESLGKGVYKNLHPETAQKNEKTVVHKVLVQPTEHHPAQIEKWTENVITGVYKLSKTNGMITPAEKSKYLERIDNLIQAMKKARQRANSTEVEKRNIGNKLFDYILEGK